MNIVSQSLTVNIAETICRLRINMFPFFGYKIKKAFVVVKLRQGSGKVRQGKARKGKDGER